MDPPSSLGGGGSPPVGIFGPTFGLLDIIEPRLLLEGETPLGRKVCVSQCAGLTLHAFLGYLLWAGRPPPGWGDVAGQG